MLSSRQMKPAGFSSSEMAFVFDMDGVIVHSMPLHTEAWEIYLRRYGIRADRATIDAKMHGKHNTEVVRAFFGENLDVEEVLAHGAEKEKLYRELMRPRLREFLVPGLTVFLSRFGNLRKALASNAEPANVEFVLDEAGLRPYFQVAISGQQVQRPKPDPAIYLLAAELLKVRPENCVVFEDSPTGIQAARGAGARVVGLTTTSPDLADCDLIIRDFLDSKLEAWLAQFPLAV